MSFSFSFDGGFVVYKGDRCADDRSSLPDAEPGGVPGGDYEFVARAADLADGGDEACGDAAVGEHIFPLLCGCFVYFFSFTYPRVFGPSFHDLDMIFLLDDTL